MTDDREQQRCLDARSRSRRSPASPSGSGCLSVPSASVSPSDLSSGHTVLLVGDSLMGGAAMSLARRAGRSSASAGSRSSTRTATDRVSCGLDRRDAPRRLRRGAVRGAVPTSTSSPWNGPARAKSRVPSTARLSSSGVARQRAGGAGRRPRARSPAHRRAAAAATAGYARSRHRAMCSPTTVGERARLLLRADERRDAGRLVVGVRRLDGAYYDTLFYDGDVAHRADRGQDPLLRRRSDPRAQPCSPPRSKLHSGWADRFSGARAARVLDCASMPGAPGVPSRAVSSGGEHFPDTEGVRGSNPLPPTSKIAGQSAARPTQRANEHFTRRLLPPKCLLETHPAAPERHHVRALATGLGCQAALPDLIRPRAMTR